VATESDKMIDEILYRLIRLAIRMMSYIPYPLGQHMGKGLGIIAYLIPMSRKEVALENIKQSFHALTEREARRLLRRVYMHFGRMFFEIPHIFRMTHNTLDRYVIFDGVENVVNAFSRNKGVFFLTAHFGNWEFLCAAGSLSAGPLAVIARPADFKPLDLMLSELRSLFGTEVISKYGILRGLRNALREKKFIGILLDQNVDWYEGVFVPFFGVPAATVTALSRIAKMTDAVVIPCYNRILPWGRGFEVRFEEPLSDFPSDDPEKDARRMNEEVERAVRLNPEQYLWGYRRFKTRPEGSPPVY